MSGRPKHGRFGALDGMRGVAALAVVVFHGVGGIVPGEPLIHALRAVDLFFVLSGFVIGYAYEDKLVDGRLSFGGFVWVRFVRLYPLIGLGVALAAIVLLGRVNLHDVRALFGAAILVVGGLTLIPLPLGDFAPRGYERGIYLNGPEWSLFFEVAINVAYAAVAPRLKSSHLVACVVVGALAMVAMEIVLGPTRAEGWNLFTSGFARVLFSFSVGLLLCRHHRPGKSVAVGLWPVLVGVALLALLLLTPRLWRHDDMILALIVLPLFVLAASYVELGKRAAAVAEWAGRVSYPLYIVHFPILRVINHLTADRVPENVRLWALTLEIPLVIGVAWLALVLFDEPVRALMSRRRPVVRSEQPSVTAP